MEVQQNQHMWPCNPNISPYISILNIVFLEEVRV